MLRLQQLIEDVGLTAVPRGTATARRCDTCRHYLNPGEPFAYCWHPDVRLLVDGWWTCHNHHLAPEA